jgi:hypothetical protein
VAVFCPKQPAADRKKRNASNPLCERSLVKVLFIRFSGLNPYVPFIRQTCYKDTEKRIKLPDRKVVYALQEALDSDNFMRG